MKRKLFTKRLANLAVGAVLSIAVVTMMGLVTFAQEEPLRDETVQERRLRCTNASLEGKYATIGDGSVRFGGPTAPMVSFSSVSLLTMDGAGGLTNKVTRSIDGNISRSLDPGTYSVNADCTGTMTIGILTFDLVISHLRRDRDASQFYFVATTPGGVVTATARRID